MDIGKVVRIHVVTPLESPLPLTPVPSTPEVAPAEQPTVIT